MKIRLINLYFGKCPEFFDVFLLSCANNPSIDFLFFVDFKVPFFPSNVQFVETTFPEIATKVQAKFDFEICLKSPYKLCDFRPAYGEIFSDYLHGYDWWGHCDFDVIFGSFSRVIEIARQSQHVKMFHNGHLVLYKNDQYINLIYRCEDLKVYYKDEVFDYKDVFTSSASYFFDEHDRIDYLFEQKNLPISLEDVKADILANPLYLKKSGILNFWGQYFIWNDGKLIRKRMFFKEGNDVEFVYIHLQKRKMAQHFDAINYKSGDIVINQFGLFHAESSVILNLLFGLISYVPNLAHMYRNYKMRIKSRLKSAFYQ